MIKNPYIGKFIAFEGIDFSGKSEQYKRIREALLPMQSVNVVFTKEPPNNVAGVEIYDILRGTHPTIKFEQLTELDMQRKYFLSRRMLYQDVNIPALRAGVNVISDRSLVSVAYGISNMAELGRFMEVQKAMFDMYNVPLIYPDLTLIYDVSVDVSLERANKKERERDKFEQRNKLEQARANYLAIGEKIPNCVIIDGSLPVEDVFQRTRERVFEILGI
jgi:dTMP kinase